MFRVIFDNFISYQVFSYVLQFNKLNSTNL
jgi:hypothetical protein